MWAADKAADKKGSKTNQGEARQNVGDNKKHNAKHQSGEKMCGAGAKKHKAKERTQSKCEAMQKITMQERRCGRQQVLEKQGKSTK